MALRDQPYLPLYVQDYLTDEKLNACSAATQGVYIKIMCVLHKSDDYGAVLIKQKNNICSNGIQDFVNWFVRQLPFTEAEIESALTELIEEKVLTIDGDKLYQRRMVKDGDISIKRVKAVSQTKQVRDKKSRTNNHDFDITKRGTKVEQNTEYENEYEDAIVNDDEDTKYENIYKAVIEHLNEKAGTSYKHTSKATQTLIRSRQKEGYTLPDFKKVIDNRCCEWLGDNKMSQFLRPSTLFGTKFESYLNKPKDPNKSYDTDQFFEAALKRSYERTS